MLNSRDIDALRPDVAANCRMLVKLSAEKGCPVLVTGTVRDDAYQLWCYNNGYSKAKTPSFHAQHAGLAFDICKNVKGQEYSDNAFWRTVGSIGKEIGFSWGGDWASFPDKPHFQWDKRGQYSAGMIRSRSYPPEMPHYQEGINMTIDEARTELTTVAGTGDRHSDWAGDAIKTFTDAEIVSGDGQGNYGWGQLVTTERMAKILYNLLDRLDLLDRL
jgi:hypothetical protein